jgi:murein L,D-transpeptidase YcbB/YkuD
MTTLQRLHPSLLIWLFGALASLLLPSTTRAVAADQMSGIQVAICSRIGAVMTPLVDAQDGETVAGFYTQRECRPLWVDEHGPTRAAESAIAELRHAADWGLEVSDFPLAAVKRPRPQGQWTSEETADAELEITGSVLRYARQAQGGRIPEPDKLLSSYLDREPQITRAADVLEEVSRSADPGAVLRSYQPSQDQFLKLKALLASLRSENTAADDVSISQRGPMLQLGVKDPEVATLKRRLGIASEAGEDEVFDAALADAVKAFQASRALGADGIVGPATRRALAGDTSSTPAKIAAVIANMEEWRWMPRSLGATHILVNVPSFSIVLTDKDKPVFEERVIVGTPGMQTPIFSKEMTTIVLRPQWNLPDSIKVSALLSGRPLERQGYVIRRNGRIVSSTEIDWSKARLSQYQIYQPSGDDNALGLVKLLFPNKHSVYLHDTPSKSLFNEPVRLFSHGCMRVRNPQDLAQMILDIDRGANAPVVKTLVRKGPMNNEIMLLKPIPVHVGYFTVWVDGDGQANFYNDYYGHQRRITLALAGKWDQIDVGRDHLAAVDTSALKGLKLGKEGEEGLDSPMGLTNGFDNVKSRSGDSVGDVIRRSLGY